MRQQSSIFSMRMLAGVAALAVLLSISIAHAGEPIQFSNDKTKPAPADPQQPVDADMFKAWNKSKRPAPSPLNSLTPFIAPGRAADPKQEKRLKNLQDEKKNWMLLEPGELQKHEEEEENQFGGKGVTIDKDDNQERNYLFYNVTQQKSDKPARHQSAPADDEGQPRKENRSSMSIFGQRDLEKAGAHTASELNLKGLVDPSQINAAKFNDNEASLFRFLKDNAAPPPDRDQQARRDSFRDFINGPQPNAPLSGISDPINFRTDLTQERLNPFAPARSGLEMSAPAKAPDSFSARPPFGGGLTPGRAQGLPEMISASSPRQPMTGNSFPSPLAIQNDPSKASRPSVMGSGSLFDREGPRRGGL